MAPRRLPVRSVLLVVFLVLAPLARTEEAQQQTAQADPPGTGDQRSEKQKEQVKEAATNSSKLEAPPTPQTKQGDSGQAAKTAPPAQPKDSEVQDAEKKAERIEQPEAPKGEDKGAGETKASSCSHKGGRLADWRAWREAGHKKPKAVLTRLACLLRSAGYRLYPVRPAARFWPNGDVCTALCHSCECDYDANSTCSEARLAWKARTPAVVYAVYSTLHHSRALCATALLLSVLRKNYVYRVVLCTPLIILLAMVTRCLYVLMQLRRYLENSATPAINTRDCSNRHSEDEDMGMSPLERHRRRDLPPNEDHPDKHAENNISKLNHTMSSLRSFSTFIETTRAYYKTKMDNSLRELLDVVFHLQEPKQ